MDTALNLQGDLPILHILLAILILLALLAAIGAWVRGGGMKREDAESMFSESQEKHRTELLRLETALEQSRKESAEALARTQNDMATRLRELHEQVLRSRSELESVVSQATQRQGEALSGELQAVTRSISDAEQRTGTSLQDLSTSVQGLQSQVKLAGDAVTRSVSEIVRQQREQKAQSTVQLCDALITSLGTLKSTISNQITQNENVVDADHHDDNNRELSGPSAWDSPFADESGSNVNYSNQDHLVSGSGATDDAPFTFSGGDAEEEQPRAFGDGENFSPAVDMDETSQAAEGNCDNPHTEPHSDSYTVDTNHDSENAETTESPDRENRGGITY